jgi:MoaA/NifB/PqqE/SkfB family radical SAM enzyme
MEELKNIGFYTMSNDRVRNASDSSQMKRCEMIITEYCNFRCPYCSGLKKEIYGNRKKKQLSLQEICQNIDYWCEMEPLENIRFSGGEPTIHPNIIAAVAYANSKGIKRIAISTNGSQSIELYENLVALGANDFSISLDACCADVGDKMSGNIKGSWEKVVKNIESIAKLTYVTVGIVLTPDNIQSMIDTIYFADSLGVADIRIISAAQWNHPLKDLNKIDCSVLNRHPILKFRVNNFIRGNPIRGITDPSLNRCGLVLDDSVIAGEYHFPCVIYMRQKGAPIGKVGPNMRKERREWAVNHDIYEDNICRENCLDICVQFLKKFKEYHPHFFSRK